MTVTGILLGTVGLVVVIGIVGAARRRLVDEGSSVRHYQHTMDTLRRLPDRRQALRPTAPRTGRGSRAGAVLAARSGPPAVTMPVEEPSPSADAPGPPAPVAPSSASPVTDAAGAVRELASARALHGPRPSRRTMPSARRPERRPAAWTVVAVVAVATVTGLALALGPSHRAAPASRATSGAATPSTSAGAHSARRPATASGRAKSTPSTAPGNGLEPVESSATSAVYQLTREPFTLQLSATGPCWVMATDAATGQVLWTGTLEAGQSQAVPSSAGLLLRLGNAANVTVAVGGQRVDMPPGSSPTIAMMFHIA